MWIRSPTLMRVLVATVLGALHAVSFAPWRLPALQVLVLAGLFALLARCTCLRRVALLTFAFGLGWFGLGVHWVYISMHHYGQMWAPLAALATAALAALLAAFPTAAMVAAFRVPSAPAPRLLALVPAAWALAEWLRGWAFTGFPWLATGYAHTDGALAGFAPVFGVMGLHWLSATLAGCAALLTVWRRTPGVAVLAALALAGGLPAAGQALRGVQWTQPVGAPIAVRLVQGNIAQDLKFGPEGLQRAAETHARLLQGPRVDLAVLPESVYPVPLNHLPPELTQTLADFVRTNRSALIFGAFVEEPGGRFFNSALALTAGPDGAADRVQRYSKRQLVPFGEFIPPGFRWFVDLMQIPIGDQQRGAPDQPPLEVAGQRIAVNICYEDLFAEIIRAPFLGPAPPTLLLNLSNLAWFDDSIALDQHLQISRMRALETGRPVLRATNTGATAIIDARGNVVAALPYLREGALDGEVAGHEGTTPYLRVGDAGALGLIAALLALVALARFAGLRRRARSG